MSRAYLLSGVVRNASDRGDQIIIEANAIDELTAKADPPSDPDDGAQRLLRWIVSHSDGFGAAIDIMPYRDYPVLYCRNPEEFEFLLRDLIERDLVRPSGTMGSGYAATSAGWREAGERARPHAKSHQAFVAMWFAKDLEAAYRLGIRPALLDTGYAPLRVDEIHHNERVDARIESEIRKSGLLVADCTGQRGGVYYEAGLAIGLGIPVIWTCRADDVAQLHFDTRQYQHVVWDHPEVLRTALVTQILATVGRAA